jgi:ATP-dependent DNA helicase RecG
VEAHGSITRAQAGDLCALAPEQAGRLLRRLSDKGNLVMRGERRWSTYVLP